MKISKLSILVLIVSIVFIGCKKKGCTDPTASNYNPEAQREDPNNPCEYNNGPTAPIITNPLNNSTDITSPLIISWEASTDPNNDNITYNVLLGTDQNSLSIVSANQTETTFTVNELDLLTLYYVKIEAVNQNNASTSSTTNEFTSSKFGSFTDNRDNNTYGTVKIGDQIWMTENLRYALANESWDYNNDPTNTTFNGRLYSWSGAATAAPAGWHLPTDDEWKTLETELGMPASDLNINNYSTPRGTNQGIQLQVGGSSGMEFYPAGYRSGTSYSALGNRTYLWVNTTNTNGDPYRRRLVINDPSVYRFTNPEAGFAISIRLIKDE